MKTQNAEQLLAYIMDWTPEDVKTHLPQIQLLANYKYDHYQRFSPGRHFFESFVFWLQRFETTEHKKKAFKFIVSRLVFISDNEFSHIVQITYLDLILQERIKLVAEENDIEQYLVTKITNHPRFNELKLKSLYLGLSDGARTNELRRAAHGEISNEQIWQAYELSEEKAVDMLKNLRGHFYKKGDLPKEQYFNLIWLLDDFSGSGNTYIRYDENSKKFKGKIPKIYKRLMDGDLVDPSYYEVFLILYVATRQSINHIEYWSEKYTTEFGYTPLQLRVIQIIETDIAINSDNESDADIIELINHKTYYDLKASDKHTKVGGTDDVRYGFAGCALPLVLSHNTPNNSIYLLWGAEGYSFEGLFPRVSRHVGD